MTDPQLTGAAPGFLTETKTIMLSTIPAPPYAELAARLAIVEDERDVALARAEMEVAARDMLRAEGERRATAAIVADLRAMSALYSTGLPSALAARYATGEHLAAQEQEQEQTDE